MKKLFNSSSSKRKVPNKHTLPPAEEKNKRVEKCALRLVRLYRRKGENELYKELLKLYHVDEKKYVIVWKAVKEKLLAKGEKDVIRHIENRLEKLNSSDKDSLFEHHSISKFVEFERKKKPASTTPKGILTKLSGWINTPFLTFKKVWDVVKHKTSVLLWKVIGGEKVFQLMLAALSSNESEARSAVEKLKNRNLFMYYRIAERERKDILIEKFRERLLNPTSVIIKIPVETKYIYGNPGSASGRGLEVHHLKKIEEKWEEFTPALWLTYQLDLYDELSSPLFTAVAKGQIGAFWVVEKWRKLLLRRGHDLKDKFRYLSSPEQAQVKQALKEEFGKVIRGAIVTDYSSSYSSYDASEFLSLVSWLGLQNELKPELMVLKFNGYNKVREWAEDIWKEAGLGDVKKEYDEMKAEEEERVKELIREATEGTWGEAYGAIKLVDELGLQNEFLNILIESVFDDTWIEFSEHYDSIPIAALDNICKLDKRFRKKGISVWKRLEEQRRINGKNKLEVLIKESGKSDNNAKRLITVQVIDRLHLQNEFKHELTLLMFDGDNKVRETARDTWKNAKFGDVKAVYEAMDKEEKDQLKGLIKEAVKSNSWERRAAAVKLIHTLGLQAEFLEELVWLALDDNIEVAGVADEALDKWDEELKKGGSSIRIELEKKRKQLPLEVKEKVKEAIKSNEEERRTTIIKLIAKLELQRELLDILVELVFDKNPDVRNAAKEILVPWAKEMQERLTEGKARLANPFAPSTQAKLIEELLLAMTVLCS